MLTLIVIHQQLPRLLHQLHQLLPASHGKPEVCEVAGHNDVSSIE